MNCVEKVHIYEESPLPHGSIGFPDGRVVIWRCHWEPSSHRTTVFDKKYVTTRISQKAKVKNMRFETHALQRAPNGAENGHFMEITTSTQPFVYPLCFVNNSHERVVLQLWFMFRNKNLVTMSKKCEENQVYAAHNWHQCL